ncbi:uncharacterized protein LOC113237495 [Hyposmocoma kahamanoa]|uniref:uncharacterized protein LOC113237495 n=1 Tax=Hyposmocoma kahamanoa TaxID=1477025 RepID=UPI000E6D829B|nr:uncharacterized protein LOC113237495 [Hyposmocoma kahamanoa]
MLLVFLVSALATMCVGRPYGEKINPYNTVTVPPPKCPPGQQWINGQCRDVWNVVPKDEFLVAVVRLDADEPRNVVTLPQNCPNGQQWINGQCREVWSFLLPHNTVTVPPNCPPGQEYINGACREVWNGDLRSILRSEVVDAIVHEFKNSIIKKKTKDAMRNIITVPNQCPNGTKPDALGICRPVFK